MVILAGLVFALAGFWPVRESLGQADQRSGATANRIEGLPIYGPDHDSGPMAIHALRSCLEFTGLSYTYSNLAGVSGAAFKFVYDTTGAYEPLRDLFPVDVLRTAAEQLGFEDAHWSRDGSRDYVMGLIKREIDAGRPLIAPDLRAGKYSGLCVITGYDLETGYVLIQGAFRRAGYDSVRLGDAWDGPTASPEGWASNPVFILGRNRIGTGDARAGRDKPAVAAAIEIMKGGDLEYGRHPGEAPYLVEAGPHTAMYGLKAFELLSHDVADRPLVTVVDGEPQLDLAFLWRIDSQVGQLQHDRTHAYTFLRQLRSNVQPGQYLELEELYNGVQATSEDARSLRQIFWQTLPPDVTTGDGAIAYARQNPYIVIDVAPRAGVADQLKSMGETVFDTPWGSVLVDDTPEKRMGARLLVRALTSRERNSIRLLEDLLPGVDSRLEQQRPAGQERPRRKRRTQADEESQTE
jgi:hypothetical protein